MIRPVRKSDAEHICSIYNHYIQNTIITFEETPVGTSEMEKRITEVTATFPWLVYEEFGTVAGYAYAFPWKGRCAYRYTVEATVYVKNGMEKKGIGAMLYEQLLAELPKKNIHTVVACLALPNEGSQRLHEKFGFEKTAHFREVGYKFEKWIDVGYWELVFP
ncbi:MAG: N-acetyltransferase [Spirochaetales bacterium]|nr:N-acetyltransferase [Spirochaetales bacterium]